MAVFWVFAVVEVPKRDVPRPVVDVGCVVDVVVLPAVFGAKREEPPVVEPKRPPVGFAEVVGELNSDAFVEDGGTEGLFPMSDMVGDDAIWRPVTVCA